VEAGFFECSVGLVWLAPAGNADLVAGQVRNNDTVMGAVGDEKAPSRLVSQNFAGEIKRTVTAFRKPSQLEGERLFVERLLPPMDLDELVDQGVGGGSEALSGITPHGVALGVDQDQGRPGAHAITPPDGHVGVVDDG